MNKYFVFLTLFFLSIFFVVPVFAEDFVITHVGTLQTKGKKFNQWWYEPQRVILKGTGSRGANIDVTLDGKFNVTKASVEDGKWEYDLGTLAIADHNVIVASGDQSHSFILTIGSSPPADMNEKKGGLPAAGGFLPLIGLLGLAGILIYMGFKKSEA